MIAALRTQVPSFLSPEGVMWRNADTVDVETQEERGITGEGSEVFRSLPALLPLSGPFLSLSVAGYHSLPS